jgi:divalent metal cation (Fe/Co/Zn/Cd) transporter
MPEELRTAQHLLARFAATACAYSVAWAALAGLASVAAGTITGSVALLAFGLDSVIDGSASGILLRRFRREARQAGHPGGAERVTARAVAVAMLAAAAYVIAQAGWSLITGAHPRQSTMGIILLAGSVTVLPVLGWIKLRLARQLRSLALRGDGILSAAGAVLAATGWLAWPRTRRWAGGRPTRPPHH